MATVDDVARAACLTTGAIYTSFASKEALFSAAVSCAEGRFESAVSAAISGLPRAAPASVRLGVYLRTTGRMLETEPDLMAFRATAWVDLARQPQIQEEGEPLRVRRRNFCLSLLGASRRTSRSMPTGEDLVDVTLLAAEGLSALQSDTILTAGTSSEAVVGLIEHLLFGNG